MVDMVVDRRELRERLAQVIDLLRRPGPSAKVLPLKQPKAAKEEKEGAKQDKKSKAPAAESDEEE
jgi:hypothetical protein